MAPTTSFCRELRIILSQGLRVQPQWHLCASPPWDVAHRALPGATTQQCTGPKARPRAPRNGAGRWRSHQPLPAPCSSASCKMVPTLPHGTTTQSHHRTASTQRLWALCIKRGQKGLSKQRTNKYYPELVNLSKRKTSFQRRLFLATSFPAYQNAGLSNLLPPSDK